MKKLAGLYVNLTDRERFCAILDAADRDDETEIDRLFETAPVVRHYKRGSELGDLLDGARSVSLAFVCHWHRGLIAFTTGLLSGAHMAARMVDGEGAELRALIRKHERLDEMHHAGHCRLLALLWAWDDFCEREGVAGPALLRVQLGAVAGEVAGYRKSMLDAALAEVRKRHLKDVTALVGEIGEELDDCWRGFKVNDTSQAEHQAEE